MREIRCEARKISSEPLALGAPAPLREIPFKPSRMIHFFDPVESEDGVEGARRSRRRCDVLLGNLEDAIQADNKIAAREGLVKIGRAGRFRRHCQLWTRVNSLDSPVVPRRPDDARAARSATSSTSSWSRRSRAPGTSTTSTACSRSSRRKRRARRSPLLVHAILETPLGVANVEEICAASPRMQGLSLGPADLAASRRMKTTRVGGGHPGYLVRQRSRSRERRTRPRATAQQDLWHYTMARMVDACTANGILPYYGPFGDINDTLACEDQFRERVPDGLRRRLEPASGPDRHREEGLLARPSTRCSGRAR